MRMRRLSSKACILQAVVRHTCRMERVFRETLIGGEFWRLQCGRGGGEKGGRG
jgi:hypothetical protein